MKVGVPKETTAGERRVGLVPDGVTKLAAAGLQISVQAGAGAEAFFTDEAYQKAGATLVPDARALFSAADAVLKLHAPSLEEVSWMHAEAISISFLQPSSNAEVVKALARQRVTAFSLELVPRISRAQSMDALSSQAGVSGYKSVLMAANRLGKFFPLLITAAGTVTPARVLVLGAGVAGLQAIATARRLGAVVSAYDTRAVVKEQVQSLGATFLEIDLGADAEGAGGYAKELTPEQIAKQRQFMVDHIGASDVVITTALVPGRPAPLLITEEAVAAMAPGSVIVDLAAEAGGNCALTTADQTVVTPNGVHIIGRTNLPATMPQHASQLYSRNVQALLDALVKDGALVLDPADEIARGTTIVRNGEVVK